MSDQNTTKERYAILLPPHITQAKAERLAKWVTWQVDPHGDEENAGLIELPSGDPMDLGGLSGLAWTHTGTRVDGDK